MFKTLAASVREYKGKSIASAVLVAFEVIMECLIPFVAAILIKNIDEGCELPVVIGWGMLLILLAIISLTFGALAGRACATASCGFAKNLRHDLYARVQDFSFGNIDKFSSASLVTRLTTDVANVQMAYMMLIRVAIRSPLMLVFALVMGFVMGGSMAVIFLAIVPILAFGLIMVIRLTMPLFRRVFRRYDKLNESIEENIIGARVVKSFVREDYENEKFDREAKSVCADFTKAGRALLNCLSENRRMFHNVFCVRRLSDGKYVAAIEVTDGKIIQAYAKENTPIELDKELDSAYNAWRLKNRLTDVVGQNAF